MTRQELLDEIDRRSRAGLFPSNNPDSGFCMYRGEGGRKCFAGIGIPDEKYRSDMEGRAAVRNVIQDVIDTEPGLTPQEWRNLQNIHDHQPADLARWDHDKVMAEVLALPFFAGMTPTPVEVAS